MSQGDSYAQLLGKISRIDTDTNQQIREDAVAVLVGYQWAGEAAETYFEVSRKHIMPGIKKIDDIMAQGVQPGSRKDLNKSIQGIANIAKAAERDIIRFADTVSRGRKSLHMHYILDADVLQRRDRLQASRYETQREVLEMARNELETMSELANDSGTSDIETQIPHADEPVKVESTISHAEKGEILVFTMPGAFNF
jgi:hypothetical protein